MRDSKQDVLHFWFEESQPAQWFQVNPDYDRLIRDRFSVVVRMAREGLCDLWADDDADGALALCIVLDQFPRNIFRGQADAFASALMIKAGLGTGPQKSLFRKLESLAGGRASAPAWLMSHPKTGARIAAIEKLEARWGVGQAPR